MKELKKDFESRLDENKEFLFETFSGKKYSIKNIKFYFFYVFNKLKIKTKNIILICNPSIESHILSTFFIFSEFDIYLINNYSFELLKTNEESTLIVLDELNYNNIISKNLFKNIILAPSIEDFLKWTHPSFDIDLLFNNYKKNHNIGKSIFMSSGSTGEPKIIPLTYSQINECYKNVKDGFLKNLIFKKIISFHDTSFVIILPFIFCIASKNQATLVACDIDAIRNPILKFITNFEKHKNHIIISVPSIYRIILKLIKNNFKKFISDGHIISCGEPLDKKLALVITNANPKTFFNLYGSTEVAPWILHLNVKNYLKKFKANDIIPSVLPAGIPLPNVLLNINSEGELLVNSKSVFNGYEFQNNAKNFWRNNNKIFFKTGDLFQKVGENYFCKGRINSSLKIAGIFVNPILLELEIKDKTPIENLIIIPDIIQAKLKILIFSNNNDSINDLYPLIKKIINKNSSLNMPTEFILDNNLISYQKSGKIDRNFYKKKYIN